MHSLNCCECFPGSTNQGRSLRFSLMYNVKWDFHELCYSFSIQLVLPPTQEATPE